MKVKTSELIGPALDYAVASCEMMRPDYRDRGLLIHRVGYGMAMPPYSTDWAQGGPIIDREEIGFAKYGPNGTWKAVIGATPRGVPMYGPTPLIAAMRCYCCTKLGGEIDIPQELQSCQ